MLARAISAAPAANSARSASVLASRTWRAHPTRRRCGEARCVCGAGRSQHADRRLCLRPPHDRGIAKARLAGRCHRAWRRFSAPDAATKAAARDKLANVPKDCPIIVDGLAFGALPEAAKE